jgi:hypothetical protein
VPEFLQHPTQEHFLLLGNNRLELIMKEIKVRLISRLCDVIYVYYLCINPLCGHFHGPLAHALGNKRQQQDKTNCMSVVNNCQLNGIERLPQCQLSGRSKIKTLGIIKKTDRYELPLSVTSPT